MKTIIKIFIILLSFTTDAQRNHTIEDVKVDFEKVKNCETFTYFGIDFSMFRLNHTRKAGTEYKIIEYFPAWISEFDAEWVKDPYNSKMRKSFKKKKVLEQKQKVQSLYKKLEGEEWVTFSGDNITMDDIQKQIQTYELNPGTTGVGFVIIVELFDKPSEKAYVDLVFFDIESRNILWYYKTYGYANQSGMTRHWANAISSAYLHFLMAYDRSRKGN